MGKLQLAGIWFLQRSGEVTRVIQCIHLFIFPIHLVAPDSGPSHYARWLSGMACWVLNGAEPSLVSLSPPAQAEISAIKKRKTLSGVIPTLFQMNWCASKSGWITLNYKHFKVQHFRLVTIPQGIPRVLFAATCQQLFDIVSGRLDKELCYSLPATWLGYQKRLLRFFRFS